MFAYGFVDDEQSATASPSRASRVARHRPGQHLGGRRQAAAQGPHRHRRRGRARPRSPSSPTPPPTPSTWRPTWSARPSTTRSPPPSSSPTARSSPRRVAQALPAGSPRTKHTERVARGARGHASPASSSSTTSTPVSTSSTPMPPSTWRSRPATPQRSPRASATPVRSSSARMRRSSLGDYAAGSNHVLPTAGCACHSSGLSVQSFLRGIHVVEYDEPALRDIARHVVTLAEAEDLPAHGEAVTARFGDERPPVSDDAAAARATSVAAAAAPGPAGPDALRRAPARRPRPAQHQRELATRCRTTSSRPSSRRSPRPASPQPLPRPRFTELRKALTAYLENRPACRSPPTRSGRATAPTRCCCTSCRPSAGRARTALGFTPELLDAPDHQPQTSARPGSTGCAARRAGDFDLDGRVGVRAGPRAPSRTIVFLCSPNNPTGTALPLDVIGAVLDAAPDAIVVVDEAYAEFARPGTPSALDAARRPSPAGRHPDHEQGLRLRRRPPRLPRRHPSELVDALRLVRLPYHLSDPTQAVARVALEHAELMLSTVDAIKAQRDRIVSELAALGATPVASDSNFVLFGGLRRREGDVAGPARPRHPGPRRRHPSTTCGSRPAPRGDDAVPRRDGGAGADQVGPLATPSTVDPTLDTAEDDA